MRDDYGYNTLRYISHCPYCNNDFMVNAIEQDPGYRFPEDMICPYCHKVNGSSMNYEFETEKLPERIK